MKEQENPEVFGSRNATHFTETEIKEFKKSTGELKEAMISIASILTKHHKGELYFGIRNDGKIIGQAVTDKTIRDVSKAISDHIEPKIHPVIEEVELEGKKCIKVEFAGNDIPYYAYGIPRIRVGDEDKKLNPRQMEQIILEKNKDQFQWDKEICKDATLKDINQRKVQWFLKEAGLKFDSIENALQKLGLMTGKKLRNAAVILFGKHPEEFFPNAKLRCASFGTDNTAVMIDMHDYEGDLFSLIEKAQDYILGHINIGMRLEGMRRVDVPEIDKDAFREAIINAFCHRDYYKYDSINIPVFKDRVEIRNPGELYGGLTIEKIKKEEVSKRRNELLAEMFHKVHFVERWGRGIGLILSKEPTAEFEEYAGLFIATFKRKRGETTPKTVRKTVGKTVGKILALITENPQITREELAEKTGLSVRGVEWNLQKLKEKKMIRRVGGRKEGHWEVVK